MAASLSLVTRSAHSTSPSRDLVNFNCHPSTAPNFFSSWLYLPSIPGPCGIFIFSSGTSDLKNALDLVLFTFWNFSSLTYFIPSYHTFHPIFYLYFFLIKYFVYSDPSVYRFSYNFLIDLFYSLFASIAYLLRVLFCLITFTEVHAYQSLLLYSIHGFLPSSGILAACCCLLTVVLHLPTTFWLSTLGKLRLSLLLLLQSFIVTVHKRQLLISECQVHLSASYSFPERRYRIDVLLLPLGHALVDLRILWSCDHPIRVLGKLLLNGATPNIFE